MEGRITDSCLEVVSSGKSKTDSLIQQQILRFFAKSKKSILSLNMIHIPNEFLRSNLNSDIKKICAFWGARIENKEHLHGKRFPVKTFGPPRSHKLAPRLLARSRIHGPELSFLSSQRNPKNVTSIICNLGFSKRVSSLFWIYFSDAKVEDIPVFV